MHNKKFILLLIITINLISCGIDDLELSIIPDSELLESQIIQSVGSLEALRMLLNLI